MDGSTHASVLYEMIIHLSSSVPAFHLSLRVSFKTSRSLRSQFSCSLSERAGYPVLSKQWLYQQRFIQAAEKMTPFFQILFGSLNQTTETNAGTNTWDSGKEM